MGSTNESQPPVSIHTSVAGMYVSDSSEVLLTVEPDTAISEISITHTEMDVEQVWIPFRF